MADPVSILGTITGLVAAGSTAVVTLNTYIDGIRCREEDVASVSRQCKSLRLFLDLLQRSQFQSSDQDRVSAVRTALHDCQTEVDFLQTLLHEVQADPAPPTTLKGKMKEQTKKLTFPFKRERLDKLENRVHKVNAALSISLQLLGLGEATRIAETISDVKMTTSASAAEITRIKANGEAHLQSISTLSNSSSQFASEILGHVEEVKQDMRRYMPVISQEQASLAPRMEDIYDTTQSMNRILLEMMPLLQNMSRSPRSPLQMIMEKPESCRKLCKAVSPESSQSRSSQFPTGHLNRERRNESSEALSVAICSCRKWRSYSRRRTNWPFLQLVVERDVQHEHSSECTFSKINTDQTVRRVGVTYLGLRKLLSIAVSATLTTTFGAGGASISPSISYVPIVDRYSSPAFRIMDIVHHSIRQMRHLKNSEYSRKRQEHLGNSLLLHGIGNLQQAYISKRSHPGEIARQGVTVLLMAMSIIHELLAQSTEFAPPTNLLWFFKSVSSMSLFHGVDRNPQHLWVCLFYRELTSWKSNSTFETWKEILALLCAKDWDMSPDMDLTLYYYNSISIRSSTLDLPHMWSDQGQILEAAGFGPLMTATLQRDESLLSNLIATGPSIQGVEVRSGVTPLHISASWHSGLKLLLESPASVYLHQRDRYDLLPIDVALEVAGRSCPEPRERNCGSCSCSRCVQLLLDAGSSPITSSRCLQIFFRSSCHAKVAVLERFRDVLREFDNRAFGSPGSPNEGLDQLRNGAHDASVAEKSVYRSMFVESCGRHPVNEVAEVEVADLVWSMGFHNLDALSNMDIVDIIETNQLLGLWLVRHGVNPCQAVTITGNSNGAELSTTIAHLVFKQDSCFRNSSSCTIRVDIVDLLSDLISKVLANPLRDDCTCGCSTNGCTPFSGFLTTWKAGCDSYGENTTFFDAPPHDEDSNRGVGWRTSQLFQVLDIDANHGDNLSKQTIRWLTFTALELPHTCCRIVFQYDERKHVDRSRLHPFDANEMKEIQEEDKDMLLLLDNLTEEFEQRHREQDCLLSEFILGHWPQRMGAVLQGLEREPAKGDIERAEAVGVVFGPMRPPVKTTKRSTLEEQIPESPEEMLEYFKAKMDEII